MSTTNSPNMNLVIPGVGTESGPDWASDINSSLTLIDQHNHSTGQGVPIQPNGLNINSDLSFQLNNAIALRTSRYTAQSAALTLPTDIGCLYVVGNELYYNDVTGGHQIALTSNGTVNAGSGSISGLPSGTASASFSGNTFVWQSATSTAANMDARSYVFRNSTASSKGLTLNPPLAMAADFSLTLPSLPAAQYFMTLDSSGNMAAYAPIANGITRSNLAAVGQQISSALASSSVSASSQIGTISVTVTTTGRPVMVALQPSSSATVGAGAYIGARLTATASTSVEVYFKRGATVLPAQAIAINASGTNGTRFLEIPPCNMWYLDTPSAGTYTYTAWVGSVTGASTCEVQNIVLLAYEL